MTTSNTGCFVWYELMTTDTKAARAFYSEVIGWNMQPYEGSDGYTLLMASQGPIGGVMQLPEQAAKMGAPPHWLGNVLVADIDKTVARVRELGGKILVEPSDIPKIGRYAVITDPQGAAISLIQPLEGMAPHDAAKHGEFGWHELISTDHNAAFAFYREIFGWEQLGEHDMGPMGKYLLYGSGGKPLGGMFTMKDMHPAFLYYVTVDDLDGSLDRAKKMGAKVTNGPMEVPGGQRIVQLQDPQGVHFALVTAPKAAS